MYYLFDKDGNFIGTSDFEPNLDDLASRGEHAVSSEQQFDYPCLIEGEIIEQGKQPSPYHQWQNGAWQISSEAEITLKNEQFTQTQHTLIRRIADKTDRLKADVLVGYPQAEIDSFYRQEAEARAWQADNTADTSMLSAIATARGVPLAVLAVKVIEKADAVSVIMGKLIGKRQQFEDRILASTALEQLTALEQEIEQWTLAD